MNASIHWFARIVRRLLVGGATIWVFCSCMFLVFWLAPNEALWGLRMGGDRKTRVSEADIARLRDYLDDGPWGIPAGGPAFPVATPAAFPVAVNGAPYFDVFYQDYGTNPFVDVEDDNLSTFALDVDTASYTVMRRYLEDGHLPDPASVRVEEYINHLQPEYAPPEDPGQAFAIHLEGGPAPFGGEKYNLLQIGLQGYKISDEARKDMVLIFVVDTSGSMNMENRLELVKHALETLVENLRPTDMIGIVEYGSQARNVLQPTPVSDIGAIMTAIWLLNPSGSTNAEHGLQLGYQMAAENFQPEAVNRIILCSDGVANTGTTSAEALLRDIRAYAERGIYLTTIGFGMGNYNDVLMEKLADGGDGQYFYVDDWAAAREVFLENLTGILQPIARDAKVQVEFNPAVVRSYRLLGYENRDVADQDFRNDEVDAGEVGAGFSVTALYEMKFVEESQGTALTVTVRYEDVATGEIVEVWHSFERADFEPTLESTSPQFRLSAAVAEFAEILSESYWAKESSLDAVIELAEQAVSQLGENEKAAEFLALARQARLLWELVSK